MLNTEWLDTPYRKRQVYAALKNVPVELCKTCPYYYPNMNNYVNVDGQTGTCYCYRAEAKDLNMKGKPNCLS